MDRSGEKGSAYLDTLHRMEKVAMVDRDTALASIAISLKRIADLLEVAEVGDGRVITLPQIMLRGVRALESIAYSLEIPGPNKAQVNLGDCIAAIAGKG